MKKISEIKKSSDHGYVSLNKEAMMKIRGGKGGDISYDPLTQEDRLCNGGCGATANYITLL